MVKVTRSMPAPESLAIEKTKANGSYSKPDVVDRLKRDFYDKCYICELKGLSDPQIEHLLPHNNGADKDRMFDWNNLFWACGHCNRVKNQGKYDNGILDCCMVDPEVRLLFYVDNDSVKIVPTENEDAEAALTAELLCEVYNLTNTGMRIVECAHRVNKLLEQMNRLYKVLNMYRDNPGNKIIMRMLKVMLRRDSEFAAFKRCYVRLNMSDWSEFME